MGGAGGGSSHGIMSHCSAVVERDAAASRVIELEREINSLKTELSQVQYFKTTHFKM